MIPAVHKSGFRLVAITADVSTTSGNRSSLVPLQQHTLTKVQQLYASLAEIDNVCKRQVMPVPVA
jgi:hypothetical protein